MPTFTHLDIAELEKYYRVNLINQASGIKSANLIGTASSKGDSNLAIFNSVIHIGANPPAMGFVMRLLTVERHTYENIKSTGCFTINLVNKSIYKKAHQTSAKYEKGISEFDKVDLQEEFIDGFSAPFVKESKVKIGLTFKEEHHVKFNSTILIIGKIELLKIDDSILTETGHLNHETAETISVSGLDTYFKSELLSRETFARPD